MHRAGRAAREPRGADHLALRDPPPQRQPSASRRARTARLVLSAHTRAATRRARQCEHLRRLRAQFEQARARARARARSAAHGPVTPGVYAALCGYAAALGTVQRPVPRGLLGRAVPCEGTMTCRTVPAQTISCAAREPCARVGRSAPRACFRCLSPEGLVITRMRLTCSQRAHERMERRRATGVTMPGSSSVLKQRCVRPGARATPRLLLRRCDPPAVRERALSVGAHWSCGRGRNVRAAVLSEPRLIRWPLRAAPRVRAANCHRKRRGQRAHATQIHGHGYRHHVA